jgi:hypothetical protein
MNRLIIITKAEADSIRGNYGRYSAIEPIAQPDGNYAIPEACKYDSDLYNVRLDLDIDAMSGNTQDVQNLPDVGEPVYSGWTYMYGAGVMSGYSEFVICRQSHTRMAYEPWDTPALFTFTRPSISGVTLEWISNEYVYVGWRRVYSGITYEVIQEHLTQFSWVPPLTLNVLWKKYVDPFIIPDWVQPTGASDAYNIGDKVKFEGAVYESIINANVWSPSVYPAGWQWLYNL